MDRPTEALKRRWAPLLLTLVLLLGLSPTATPHTQVEAVRAALVAAESGRSGVALDSLESALAYEPALAALHLPAAELALNADQPERALQHLKHAPPDLQRSRQALCLYARSRLAMGAVQEARREWERNPEICPQEDPFLEDLARAHLERGKPETTIAMFAELAQRRPHDAELQLTLSLVTATHSPEEALPFLRQAHEVAPEGSLLALEMIRTIEESRLAQDTAYTFAQIGQTLSRHGLWEEAVWAFQKALQHEPGYVEARGYLALALEKSGENGLEALREVVSEVPTAVTPRLFLASAWMTRGQPDRALKELEVAAHLDPEDAIIAAKLGAAYAASGEVRKARAAYRKATELAPQEARFWLLLAQFSLQHEIEVSTLALPAARNAVTLAPGDPAALDSLGYAHLLLGHFTLAERLLWRALEEAPSRPSTQIHLGLLRQMQGDHTRARAAFQMARKLDPDGSAGEWAQNVLEVLSP